MISSGIYSSKVSLKSIYLRKRPVWALFCLGYKDCAVRQYSTGGGDPEKTRERAMNDPEVQQIMGVSRHFEYAWGEIAQKMVEK